MKTPKHIWADYDPTAGRGNKWAFYATKDEQRGNRPDLSARKLAVLDEWGLQDLRDEVVREITLMMLKLHPAKDEKAAVELLHIIERKFSRHFDLLNDQDQTRPPNTKQP